MHPTTTLERPQSEKIKSFRTSSLDLTDFETIVAEMESYASSDPEASPADIMERAQEEWSKITPQCTKDNILDDSGFFVQLNMLYLRLIRASVEARVHWARTSVAQLVSAIRSGQISFLHETEKERKTWWQNGGIDWDTEEGQMIWDTERAYESAATAVQGLREEDQKVFESVIAGMRTTLRHIGM